MVYRVTKLMRHLPDNARGPVALQSPGKPCTGDDPNGRASRRGFLAGSASALWVFAAASGLGGCKKDKRSVPSETHDWPEYRLGYHVFRPPPDFAPPVTTATIGTMELRVLRDQVGSLPDILALQPDVGETVHHQKAGGWDIFVTLDDNGLLVSSYSLHIIGLIRVGPDVVLTHDRIARQRFPDGKDIARWHFHMQTSVEVWAGQQSGEGFAYSGMLFRTNDPAWLATAGVRFSAYATLADLDEGRRQSSSARNSYNLAFRLTGHQQGDSFPQQMVPGPDVSAFPGAKVAHGSVQTEEAEGGFSTVTLTANGETATWFDAALFWQPGDRRPKPGEVLVSAHLNFINAMRPVDEAEARALGLVHSIRNEQPVSRAAAQDE